MQSTAAKMGGSSAGKPRFSLTPPQVLQIYLEDRLGPVVVALSN